MSGHSKWSTIKRQKAATDQKRGKIFSKLAGAISIAAREGGGDPNSNFKLRLAMDKAREANMPKDNVERAIAKGTGTGGDGALEEVMYEGFSPVSGVAVLVSCVTDKKQRTVAEVKNLIEKSGGTFGTPGSAAHLFELVGQIVVSFENTSFDEVFEKAVDAGAQEVEEEDGVAVITTAPTDLQRVKEECEVLDVKIEDASLVYVAKANVDIDLSLQKKLQQFVEKIEEHDDVQSVYTNALYA